MSFFKSTTELRFYPESYLPNAPYIPLHFQFQQVTYDATLVQYELDKNGQTSIIHLSNKDEIIIPFVDINRYDSETKDWFWYDPDTNFPFRFNKYDNTLVSIYPTDYSTLTLTLVAPLSFNASTSRLEATFVYSDDKYHTFYKYSPLILTVAERAYLDLSDYSSFKPTDRLNRVNVTNQEFYYDFDSRIFTNQNLAGIDPARVKIHLFKISDNSVQIKCRMSSNAGSETYFTPKVNNYIAKLKGQSLRV